MGKIDNIKNLYEQIIDKKDFIEKVAEEFERSVSTIRIGWFIRFELPARDQVQDRLIKFMQTYINLKQ